MGEVWQRHWGELCSKQVRRFESVVLKETLKEELLNDLLAFRTQKEWYTEQAFPIDVDIFSMDHLVLAKHHLSNHWPAKCI